MDLRQVITSFGDQFLWNPEIKNADGFSPSKKMIAVGMGGSHLAADILKAIVPGKEVVVYEDYNLPEMPEEDRADALFVISSYSGNTEESLDVFSDASKKGYKILVISSGGKLLEEAQKNHFPYIELPEDEIQPRFALGWSFKAFARAAGEEKLLKDAGALAGKINPVRFEQEGRRTADFLSGRVPIIYASQQNAAVAYNWKIKMNESVKIPAFYNLFPELNHNEMAGFDANGLTKKLSEKFGFIFIRDSEDEPQIIKRMDITEKIYAGKKLLFLDSEMKGGSRLEKIFSSLIVADWVSLYLAEDYGVDPEPVPFVAEFKKLMAE